MSFLAGKMILIWDAHLLVWDERLISADDEVHISKRVIAFGQDLFFLSIESMADDSSCI